MTLEHEVDPPVSSGVRSPLLEHLGYVISAGLALVVVLRRARVSNWSADIAFAIMRHVGTGTVAVATL